jgi:hypothetical protein
MSFHFIYSLVIAIKLQAKYNFRVTAMLLSVIVGTMVEFDGFHICIIADRK